MSDAADKALTEDIPAPLNAKVLAICGGVGGAKLALGFYRILKQDQLTVAINTGDDFEHLGLHVSPDIDTVTYTLSGLNDTQRGWGLKDESWNFMTGLGRLGGETWFNLGDQDMATHVLRTAKMKAGEKLSTITADFARALDIRAKLLPMSDDPVRTMVDTSEGELPFQRYFVGRQCEPEIRSIRFSGINAARPHPAFIKALADPELTAIVICPSNPYLSIDPILALPGLRDALSMAPAPVIAVAPIVGGRAIKGPTAKIMQELRVPTTVSSIAQHYTSLIDGLIVDNADAADILSLTVRVAVTGTVMDSLKDRERLARTVIDFARSLKLEQAASAR
ncbi:2-phospho-L-lactate transferase [Martelella sp. HB161492]|uniref:2-phospho-L-lactate transferase n=1 Tax=Martelella sp. HB161492 TaxID=2720726 RepID=UPI00158FADEA|nr:2-phospho-L-lactate transferase [Martelella sp. HB161492]